MGPIFFSFKNRFIAKNFGFLSFLSVLCARVCECVCVCVKYVYHVSSNTLKLSNAYFCLSVPCCPLFDHQKKKKNTKTIVNIATIFLTIIFVSFWLKSTDLIRWMLRIDSSEFPFITAYAMVQMLNVTAQRLAVELLRMLLLKYWD